MVFFRFFRIASGLRFATFACPGCGGEFRPEWYKMAFKIGRFGNLMYLKCPICKKRGVCRGVK